ncbi:serine aminopeptidase domain-containing protein [Nocardia transvalensis]|uniref:serine aminopeptidase domain-containing protein n=1 Tax=Nocardia transvalensis TaxID=37333 RepID=UPI003570ABA7
MAPSREWAIQGSNGEIVGRTWTGDGAPRYVVVLVHGYGEHVGRYEYVADVLVGHGARGVRGRSSGAWEVGG